jgi:hypothetical protein
MLVHVDANSGASTLAPEDMLAKAQALVKLQTNLSTPKGQGRQIKMPG